MNIAIIGAGNVDRALASSSTRAGRTVTVRSNDGPAGVRARIERLEELEVAL